MVFEKEQITFGFVTFTWKYVARAETGDVNGVTIITLKTSGISDDPKSNIATGSIVAISTIRSRNVLKYDKHGRNWNKCFLTVTQCKSQNTIENEELFFFYDHEFKTISMQDWQVPEPALKYFYIYLESIIHHQKVEAEKKLPPRHSFFHNTCFFFIWIFFSLQCVGVAQQQEEEQEQSQRKNVFNINY